MILALVTHMLKASCIVMFLFVPRLLRRHPCLGYGVGSLGVGWWCVYMYSLRLSTSCNTPGALHT